MHNYFAYLLRIWQEAGQEAPAWRAALEDPHTRQILAFRSIEALCGHLLALASPPAANDPAQPGGESAAPPHHLSAQDESSKKGES